MQGSGGPGVEKKDKGVLPGEQSASKTDAEGSTPSILAQRARGRAARQPFHTR